MQFKIINPYITFSTRQKSIFYTLPFLFNPYQKSLKGIAVIIVHNWILNKDLLYIKMMLVIKRIKQLANSTQWMFFDMLSIYRTKTLHLNFKCTITFILEKAIIVSCIIFMAPSNLMFTIKDLSLLGYIMHSKCKSILLQCQLSPWS